MKNQTPLLPFVVLLLMTNLNYSQSSRQLLKTIPQLTLETPEWAIEMYKESPNVARVDALYTSYYEQNPFQKTTHTQNHKRWRRLVDPYVQEDGTLSIPSTSEQIRQHQFVEKKRVGVRRSLGAWSPLGPFETYNDEAEMTVSWQANVYTIDQSVSNPDVVYVGTESGGVFKSIDKGEQWQMVSQNSNIRSVSSIKVDPTDDQVVYVGDGGAIYQTLDGGESWVVVLVEDDLGIVDFAISPSNSQIVFAASGLGLYRSNDRGSSWTRIHQGRIWDIELQPGTPSTVMMLVSNPSERKTEFWKSEDDGETFTLRTDGWYNSNDNNRTELGGRMTVTEADPNRVYVILVGNSKAGDDGYIGVYRSSDAGDSWAITNPPMGGPYDDTHNNLATLSNTNSLQQGYYNLGIAASDDDPDVVLVGCLNLWRTVDGGASFEALGGYQGPVGYIHPDQQEIEINGNDMWVVNDGGINYSTDYFDSHQSRKKGLNASEFWGFGSAWNENLIVGGRYHNGNSAHRPSYGDGNFLRLGGAEASTGYVQPGGAAVAYFSDISAKLIPEQIDEAAVNVAALSLFPNESFFASNYSELEFDPNCYGHMWLGRDNKLYKSEDNGNSFDLIKAFGEVDDPVHNIEISRVDNTVMYVYQRTTFFGAVLWVTRDGGESWQQKTFPEVGSQRSGSLAIHSSNPGSLWVTFSHQTNDGEKVFRTDDYGDTWTNISSPILDGEKIHCSFHQSGTENLFVGTDYSIYVHNGTEWSDCSDGLPQRFSTNRFQPFYKENKLRIASYGNGIWEMPLPPSALGTTPIAQPTVDKLSSNCSRDTFYFDDYSVVEHDAALAYQWEFSPPASFISDATARNPKVVFSEEGAYDVTFTVTNAQGTDVFFKEDFLTIEASDCAPDIFPDQALVLQGSGGDLVQMPTMGLTTESYTITAWVKPDGIQNDFTGIFFNDNDSYGLNFTTGNQLGFHHQGAGSAAWAWQSGAVVPSEVWSYVALVVEPNKATVYLNGVAYERELVLEPAVFETMKVGSYKGWGSRNYKGEIDEVTLWDRALSIEEIRAHRHITKTIDSNGLVAYYQFNEEGRVFDKISDKHGVRRGLAELTTSFAPVGGGTASVWTSGNESVHTFVEEDVELTGAINGGAISVSQLDILPQNMEVEDAFPNQQYFILNQYGNTTIDQLRILNTEIEEVYEASPENVLLYSREDNDSEAFFSEVTSAIAVEAGLNSTIDFAVSQDFSGQFILSRPLISATKEIAAASVKIYPNPTNESVEFEIEATQYEVSLFDAKGQRVLQRKLHRGQKLNVGAVLPAGNYTYLIETEKRLLTGQLIVGGN